MAAEREQNDIDQSLDRIDQQEREFSVTVEMYEKQMSDILGGQSGTLRTLDTGPADTERDKEQVLSFVDVFILILPVFLKFAPAVVLGLILRRTRFVTYLIMSLLGPGMGCPLIDAKYRAKKRHRPTLLHLGFQVEFSQRIGGEIIKGGDEREETMTNLKTLKKRWNERGWGSHHGTGGREGRKHCHPRQRQRLLQ